MTLENTARVDGSVRVGKVWKSPASSKPTYTIEVSVPAGTSEQAVQLDGSFKVVNAWSVYTGAGSGAGDQVGLWQGPTGTGTIIATVWSDPAIPQVTGTVTNLSAFTNLAEANVSSDSDATTLYVASLAAAGSTECTVYVVVELQ